MAAARRGVVLAGLEAGDERVHVGDDRLRDPLHARFTAPVVGVGDGDELVALLPRLELVLPRADRVEADLARLGEVALALDEVLGHRLEVARHHREEPGVRIREGELDRVVVDHLQPGQRVGRAVDHFGGALEARPVGLERSLVAGREHRQRRELDVGGGDRFAVVEHGVLAQLERVGTVVLGDRPRFGEPRDRFERHGIDEHERVVIRSVRQPLSRSTARIGLMFRPSPLVTMLISLSAGQSEGRPTSAVSWRLQR